MKYILPLILIATLAYAVDTRLTTIAYKSTLATEAQSKLDESVCILKAPQISEKTVDAKGKEVITLKPATSVSNIVKKVSTGTAGVMEYTDKEGTRWLTTTWWQDVGQLGDGDVTNVQDIIKTKLTKEQLESVLIFSGTPRDRGWQAVTNGVSK